MSIKFAGQFNCSGQISDFFFRIPFCPDEIHAYIFRALDHFARYCSPLLKFTSRSTFEKGNKDSQQNRKKITKYVHPSGREIVA